MASERRSRGVLERALALLGWFVARLPWRSLDAVGRAIGVLAGSLLRIRRRHVEDAMRRAGIDDPAAHARAMYAALGTGALELLWSGGARRAAALDAVALDPAIVDAVTRGPVVVAATHTGNWELAAFAAARTFAEHGRRLTIVAKTMSVGGFDAFCMELRLRAGLRVLPPYHALTAARAALADGDVVAMPIDQVPDRARHAVRAPFLGAPALLDRAPAALAARAGATLLVIAGERGEAGEHRVRVLASLRPPPRAGAAWAARATREANAALEAFVRGSPASWLWLHRRWKEPRERSVHLVPSPHPG